MKFRPHKWLNGGHLQTVIGKVTEQRIVPDRAERIAVQFEDGDETYVELDPPTGNSNNLTKKSVVFLFHGLGGSARSGYLTRLSHKLTSMGYHVARANHRGAAEDAAHLAKRIYHCGSTDDASTIIRTVVETRDFQEIQLVGYSLSGAVLLNLAGQGFKNAAVIKAKIKGVTAVCPPMDLEASSRALTKRENFYYDIYYSRLLKKKARQLHGAHKNEQYPRLPSRVTVREFDEVFTAPVAGFASRLDYYTRCSPKAVLDQVEVDTFILQASDDPVVPLESIGSTKNPRVTISIQPSGGHMGFVSHEKTSWGDRRWMDHAVIEWLKARSGNT